MAARAQAGSVSSGDLRKWNLPPDYDDDTSLDNYGAHGRGRLKDWPGPPAILQPQVERPDGLPDDDGGREPREDDIRNYIGYSPFEYLQFSDEEVAHELNIHVNAPRSTCYQFWSERANYLEWFDLIAQVRHRPTDAGPCRMSVLYCGLQHSNLPCQVVSAAVRRNTHHLTLLAWLHTVNMALICTDIVLQALFTLWNCMQRHGISSR